MNTVLVGAINADPSAAVNTLQHTLGQPSLAPSDQPHVTVSLVGTPASVDAGNTIAYTITLTNTGKTAAKNVVWDDALSSRLSFNSLPLPVGNTSSTGPHWEFGVVSCTNTVEVLLPNLPAGSSKSLTLIVTVNPATPKGTKILNQVIVPPIGGGVTLTNGGKSGTVTTTVTAPAGTATKADLGVTMTGTPASVAAGGTSTITYTITASNKTSSDTPSLTTITDVLPANTTLASFSSPDPSWTVATPALGAGGTITLTNPAFAFGAAPTFTLTLNVTASATGTIENTVSIDGGTNNSDPVAANNSAQVTTTVTGTGTSAPILSVAVASASVPPTSTFSAGGTIAYKITVSNTGTANATNVVFTDTPPGWHHVGLGDGSDGLGRGSGKPDCGQPRHCQVHRYDPAQR